MAYIICETHGGHTTEAVCPHLHARILARLQIDRPITPLRASYGGHTLGPIWLCPDCATRMQIPPAGATLEGEDRLDRWFIETDFVPVCRYCFNEYRTDPPSQPAAPPKTTTPTIHDP